MFTRTAARGLLAAFLSLACLVALSRPAVALDDFGIAADKKLQKALTDLADTCYECGLKAKDKGLYTNARSFFDHALRYDVDHAKTRKVMGFKKKKNEWVLEDDMIPLKDIVNESKRADIETKLITETRDLRTKAADNLFKFVADAALAPEARLLALFHVLRICPEHREAQKVARANPDTIWFKHALDSEAEALRIKRVGAIPDPEMVPEVSQYEKGCGYQMSKRRTAWFVLHLDLGDKSEAWAPELAKFCEASRTHALELMGITATAGPKEDGQKLHFTVIGTRERFATFVEKCSGIDDPSHRAEVSKVSGGTPVYKPYGSVWLYADADNDYTLRDAMAHDIAGKEVSLRVGDGSFWLERGFGYVNSVHMNGSTRAKFYGVKQSGIIDTGGRESFPGLGECAAGWRMKAAIQVAGNKAPKPSDLARTRINDFNEDTMAMSFAYADYLVNQHGDKLKSFFDGAYKERMARNKEKKPGETGQEIVSRLYTELGMDEAAFMNSFRAWAITNYVKLP